MHRLTLLSALAFSLAASGAFPCHVPDDLRYQKYLTAAQLSLLAHGPGAFDPIPYKLAAATRCRAGLADIFPCRNVDLLAVLSLAELGGGRGNDLWGWRDPETGRDYALFGRSTGVSFIDITDRENPVFVGELPTHGGAASTWRDVKVYADHAFVVADFAGAHGMQVFDLGRLRGVAQPPEVFTPTARFTGFERAHNLAINEETGFGYAVGLEPGACNSGLYMLDLRIPSQPLFAGCYADDGYTHDAQCVVYRGPDAEHRGKEICFTANEDSINVVDVTDKGLPVELSRRSYPEVGYIHQGWLTEDHAFFIQDDELDEGTFGNNTRTYVWDVSDLDDPLLAGRYTGQGPATDHNQYIVGNRTYQANYRSGLRVLALDDVAAGNLSEVGFFDTYPEGDGPGFAGAWTAYPFFGDVVLVSDSGRGLFVLRPRGAAVACTAAPGSGAFCRDCGPCDAGEGDCDGDGQCRAGLTCTENAGAQFGFRPGIDVCTAPGGGTGGGGDLGGCELPTGHGAFCRDCGPCDAGEGDCDGDGQCRSGLVCTDNVGADFGFRPGIDVCTTPDGGGPGPQACPHPAGHPAFCRDCGPCAEGQGDCDGDTQCRSGLVCGGNLGAQFGFRPNIDVCVAP